MATASTLKVITSASAFYLLGSDFRYQTRIGYTGRIDNAGVLQGDLLIVGSGDPTLGSWRWEETGEVQVLTDCIRNLKEVGRAHLWTPVTNPNPVCRLLLEKE